MKNKYLNYGPRFSKREKRAFANEIIKDFTELGYDGIVDTKKMTFSSVNNILIGNFKSARTLIVVPYDTPSKVLYPNYKYYLQDGKLMLKKNFGPVFGPMVIGYIILLIVTFYLPGLISKDMQHIFSIFAITYLILMFIFFLKGFANRNNAVKNNASVQMAYDIAKALKADQKKNVAFAFTDKNDTKMLGSKLLEEYMTTLRKKPLKIVLYCIGRGDVVSIGYKKGIRKEVNELTKKYKGKIDTKSLDDDEATQYPLEYLNNVMEISSGYLDDEKRLYIDHVCTRKDKEVDEKLIENVRGMVVDYLNSREK